MSQSLLFVGLYQLWRLDTLRTGLFHHSSPLPRIFYTVSFYTIFMHQLLQHWVSGELPISENGSGVYLNFSVSKKLWPFKKSVLLGLPSESRSSWVCWNTYPLHIEYLLQHLISKPAIPMNDSQAEGCRSQVCAPYCHDDFHLEGLICISSSSSVTQLEEWHSICFPSLLGWMHSYFCQTAWACEVTNVSVHDSLSMCLGNITGPEFIFENSDIHRRRIQKVVPYS